MITISVLIIVSMLLGGTYAYLCVHIWREGHPLVSSATGAAVSFILYMLWWAVV